ncbi:MAG: DUF2948 family protein [Pararhodobacter sp.]|nr:DUF2948 family protein [Pararhodobacter sp.]
MTDARYEDADERPLRLLARDGEDLSVISALVQDAVLTGADLKYLPGARRFSLLINRFRWENNASAQSPGRPHERVRSLIVIHDVLHVRQQGLDERSADTVLSLLAIEFTPSEASSAVPAEPAAGTDAPAVPGRVTLVFAGDGAVALDVECLEVNLGDVTRPYLAPSRLAPEHLLGPGAD